MAFPLPPPSNAAGRGTCATPRPAPLRSSPRRWVFRPCCSSCGRCAGGEGMIHGFLWEMAIEIVDLPMKNGDLCDFPEFLRYVIPEGIATIPRIWMKSLKWKSCYLKNFTKIWVIVGCETPKKDEEVGDFLRFLRWNPNILFVSGNECIFSIFCLRVTMREIPKTKHVWHN